MLRLVFDSYRLYAQKFLTIAKYALPYLLLCCAAKYLETETSTSSFHVPLVSLFMVLIPLISAATDIKIYRYLLGYKTTNPLSSPKAYFMYLFSQMVIYLIGSAPLFLFTFVLNTLGYSNVGGLTLAIFINLFIGFMFMARFNIILPLIIQNKTPTLKEFLLYTNKPYIYWIGVGLFIYIPYVILHYVSVNLPYANILLCTIITYLFACFNVCFVNKDKQIQIPIPVEPIKETIKKTVKEPQKKTVVKTTKLPPKEKKISKQTTKKATKKTTKTAKPKLKTLPA